MKQVTYYTETFIAKDWKDFKELAQAFEVPDEAVLESINPTTDIEVDGGTATLTKVYEITWTYEKEKL